MITPPGMTVGWWIELPVEDDGGTAWTQIDIVMAPVLEGDDRWAVHVRRGSDDWWARIAPHLRFPVCDVDPT